MPSTQENQLPVMLLHNGEGVGKSGLCVSGFCVGWKQASAAPQGTRGWGAADVTRPIYQREWRLHVRPGDSGARIHGLFSSCRNSSRNHATWCYFLEAGCSQPQEGNDSLRVQKHWSFRIKRSSLQDGLTEKSNVMIHAVSSNQTTELWVWH